MLVRSSVVAAALITALLTLASVAQARTVVSVTPTTGDFQTVFALSGAGWAPSRAIKIEYYDVDLNRSPLKRYSSRTNPKGRVMFRLHRPQVFTEQSLSQRLCFVQSRARRCARFYVAAPAANVEPSDVRRGTNLLLRVSGWPAAFNLNADLFRPDGSSFTTKLLTRALEPGFEFAGAPFNNVFLPKGAAFLNFLADGSTPIGLYTFYVHPPGMAVGTRTAFVVFP